MNDKVKYFGVGFAFVFICIVYYFVITTPQLKQSPIVTKKYITNEISKIQLHPLMRINRPLKIGVKNTGGSGSIKFQSSLDSQFVFNYFQKQFKINNWTFCKEENEKYWVGYKYCKNKYYISILLSNSQSSFNDKQYMLTIGWPNMI